MKAPWVDYAGRAIYAGDTLVHPSGETGIVVYQAEEDTLHDQWRVDYGDSVSRLCLQIGDKGQGVVSMSFLQRMCMMAK